MNKFEYKNLTPFKWFVLENFPFIEADFDALTEWQLFCKLGKEMNKIINSENTLGTQVESVTNAFIELQNYVNNYFKNLDVQEEINNKLNEMAESGELADIIADYIQLKGILAYNNILEMKQATNLVNGSFVETYGFYEKNDGGKAKYKIRNVINTDVINEITLFALSNNNLVAELIVDNPINVKQLGLKGDNNTDDTTLLQFALDNFNNIFIPEGTYLINANTRLLLKSNTNIKLTENTILKAIATDQTHYSILRISNVENIIIEGGTLQGERESHIGTEGEWGFCIEIINNSKNILIKDIKLINSWGDGLYINEASNIKTQNIICDNNRRQGLSIISVDGYFSLNDTFINTNGTAPSAGVDIEPNSNTNILKNIVFENPTTYNNEGNGIILYLLRLQDSQNSVDITINNHKDTGSTNGLSLAKPSNLIGTININEPIYKNNKGDGISLRDCFYNENFLIKINRPYILNFNVGLFTPTYVAGISGYTTQTTENALGGIEIFEPYITSAITDTKRRSITIYDTTNNIPVKDIKIINPLNKQQNLSIGFGKIESLIFEDKYEKNILSVNARASLQSSEIYSKIYNNRYTSNITNTLSSSFPINQEIEIINNNINNRQINIEFPEGHYCRFFDNINTGIILYLKKYGDRVKLKRTSETEWDVISLVGNPSIT